MDVGIENDGFESWRAEGSSFAVASFGTLEERSLATVLFRGYRSTRTSKEELCDFEAGHTERNLARGGLHAEWETHDDSPNERERRTFRACVTSGQTVRARP